MTTAEDGATPDAPHGSGQQDRPTPRRSMVGGWPIAIAIGIAAMLLYVVRYALLPFVLAIVVGFVLDPLVRWLHHQIHWPRWVVASLLYLLMLAMVGGAVWWGGSIVARDVSHLASEGPDIIRNLLNEALGPDGRDLFGRHITPEEATDAVLGWIKTLLGAQVIAMAAAIGIGTILGAVLTLVLIAYFLISGPLLAEGAIRLLPPERRGAVRRMLPRVVPVLRRYLVGVAGVVAFTAVMAWIGFGLIFGLPHAVLLSLTVGVLEIIPALGPFLSFVLVGLTAIQQHGLWAAIGLGLYAVALRLVIDNLVGPIMLGSAVRLHPVVVIFAFVTGASLFGVMGLLLAVPVAACTKLALNAYYAEPIAAKAPPGQPPAG